MYHYFVDFINYIIISCILGVILGVATFAEKDFQSTVERIWTLLRSTMAFPEKSQQ